MAHVHLIVPAKAEPSGTRAQHRSDRRRRAVAPWGDLWTVDSYDRRAGFRRRVQRRGRRKGQRHNGQRRRPATGLAVGLSWRIGPGGLFDWGPIRASGARLTAAQLSDEKLRDQISREVVDAYTQVQSLFEQLRVARLNLSSAEETHRLRWHRDAAESKSSTA
jgi:hypothetical protein